MRSVNDLRLRGVFAEKLLGFLRFRKANGYANSHELLYRVQYFDNYSIDEDIKNAELTQVVVNGWFNYEVKVGRTACIGKYHFIRNFSRYLMMLGEKAYLADCSCCKKQIHKEKPALTDDEIRKLFKVIDGYLPPNSDVFTHKESFPTLCRLLFTCGLRPSEGRCLRRKDVDYETGEIYIREINKTKIARVIVAKPDVIALLKSHDEKVSQLHADAEYLFVNSRGKLLTLDNVGYMFRRCWAKANSDVVKPKNASTYSLRHAFATINLYELGKNTVNSRDPIPVLRNYMGHKEFSSTLYYMHLSPERTADSYAVKWDDTMQFFDKGEKDND